MTGPREDWRERITPWLWFLVVVALADVIAFAYVLLKTRHF